MKGKHIQVCIEDLWEDTQETGNSEWLQGRDGDN